MCYFIKINIHISMNHLYKYFVIPPWACRCFLDCQFSMQEMSVQVIDLLLIQR